MNDIQYDYKLFNFTNYTNLILKLAEDCRDNVQNTSYRILEHIKSEVRRITQYILHIKQANIKYRVLQQNNIFDSNRDSVIKLIKYLDKVSTQRSIGKVFKGDLENESDIDLFSIEIYHYFVPMFSE